MLDLQDTNVTSEAAKALAEGAYDSPSLELVRFDEAELPVKVLIRCAWRS